MSAQQPVYAGDIAVQSKEDQTAVDILRDYIAANDFTTSNHTRRQLCGVASNVRSTGPPPTRASTDRH